MNAGAFLRERRIANGLSQVELARRAGTTQETISRLERGGRSPSVDTLGRLLLCMGERLELGASRRPGRHKPADLAVELRRPMAERLRHALDWNELADELAGAAIDTGD
jgi:transcriptional regulator with XRE-family HTH domain